MDSRLSGFYVMRQFHKGWRMSFWILNASRDADRIVGVVLQDNAATIIEACEVQLEVSVNECTVHADSMDYSQLVLAWLYRRFWTAVGSQCGEFALEMSAYRIW
jgi:hypothetical protein